MPEGCFSCASGNVAIERCAIVGKAEAKFGFTCAMDLWCESYGLSSGRTQID